MNRDIINNPRNVFFWFSSQALESIQEFIEDFQSESPIKTASPTRIKQDTLTKAKAELKKSNIVSKLKEEKATAEEKVKMTTRAQWARQMGQAIAERNKDPDGHDEQHMEERDADMHAAQNPPGSQTRQDANIEQVADPDIDPMRAPNGPGISGASAAHDYPTMQRAVQKGCSTICTYERVYEHVIPSTPPSKKKFKAEIKKDYITDFVEGRTAKANTTNEFRKAMTPHHTIWISSDGWFVLPQLCPAMIQNDHYMHMLGACSRSRILAAYDTIIVKELITYHTTNHATDTQQILSTKQPSLIMVQTDDNNLPTMPQWIIPTDTDIHGPYERYDWMTVEVGCGQDQEYPNEKFKKSASDDRKTEILPKYEAIYSTAIARRKQRGANAAGGVQADLIKDDWADVTINQMLGCDPEENVDWIDTAKMIKHSLRPGQGFKNNYHISATTNWNKLIDVATQRDTICMAPPETEKDLRDECISMISGEDASEENVNTVWLHTQEDCPEYDHLWIQHNPQLFWWTPISGYLPTSQFQEGHPLAALDLTEYQWVTHPVSEALQNTNPSLAGLQLRSFKSQPTDFTYNPTIMFGLTTTTYADSSWIKMDAILDVNYRRNML